MNAEWHRRDPMPRNPSLAQRIAWHRGHAKHCGCRPAPAGIKPFLRSRSSKRRRVSG